MTHQINDDDNDRGYYEGDDTPYRSKDGALFTREGHAIITTDTIDGLIQSLMIKRPVSDSSNPASYFTKILAEENPKLRSGAHRVAEIMADSTQFGTFLRADPKIGEALKRGFSYGLIIGYRFSGRAIEDNAQTILQQHGTDGEITSLKELGNCLSARLGELESGPYINFISTLSEFMKSTGELAERNKAYPSNSTRAALPVIGQEPDRAKLGLADRLAAYAAAPQGTFSTDPAALMRGHYPNAGQTPGDVDLNRFD